MTANSRYVHFKPKKTEKNPEPQARARDREVRDLFNILMKKYRPEFVFQFFSENYFIGKAAVYQILKRSDKQPVCIDTASIQYLTAIKEDFNL